jgi:hypothetical protein
MLEEDMQRLFLLPQHETLPAPLSVLIDIKHWRLPLRCYDAVSLTALIFLLYESLSRCSPSGFCATVDQRKCSNESLPWEEG